jgi:hypothetical protein
MSVGGDVATSSPFSVPFNVKNVSWLFAMSDAQMNCGLDKVVLVSPMQFTSTNVFLVSPQVTIKPGKEGAFRCAIGVNNTISCGSRRSVSGRQAANETGLDALTRSPMSHIGQHLPNSDASAMSAIASTTEVAGRMLKAECRLRTTTSGAGGNSRHQLWRQHNP